MTLSFEPRCGCQNTSRSVGPADCVHLQMGPGDLNFTNSRHKPQREKSLCGHTVWLAEFKCCLGDCLVKPWDED